MRSFVFFLLVIPSTIFAQNKISAPTNFKGDHYALYTKCGTAITFCEITQQTYTSCGSIKNCYGLYVLPGDTFYINIEDKNQAEDISADISFGGFFPVINGFIFKPIDNNCIPQQALQIAIPLNTSGGSSFQIVTQNTSYVNNPSITASIPQPFNIYVGGQQPQFTFALSDFTICPVVLDVSVKEISNSEIISTYPNPTNNSLNISSHYNIQNIEIINVTGQILLSESVNEQPHQLQLQNFAEGIYFLKVSYSNGLSTTKKIVVNR